MTLAMKLLSPERVQIYDSLSNRDIAEMVQDRQISVVQASEPISTKTWSKLNKKLFAYRPDVQLRVYGFYSIKCDLSFLPTMHHVQRFSVDCLQSVQNIEAVTQLPGLRSLGVGVFDLNDFDFLSGVPNSIEKLFLGATRSKKPSLRHLERFSGLKELYIEGQQKDLEVISGLLKLEDVTLRSVTVEDLAFLRPLSKMWSLDIKLGGSNDLAALSGMDNIKYLELWMIRGLSDLMPISSLKGLQYLFLQSLRQVTTLPDLKDLTKLRRVLLDNMKGLQTLRPLCSAPSLEELIHISALAQRPEDYMCLMKSHIMKRFRVGFGSDAKNKAFRALMDVHNKTSEIKEFVFVN
jgi:hypothetical protein